MLECYTRLRLSKYKGESTIEQKWLEEGAKLAGIDLSRLRLIGGYDKNVFEVVGEGRVLKFHSGDFQMKKRFIAEMKWTQYLGEHGVNVPRAIPFADGSALMELSQGSSWMTLTEKLEGLPIDKNDLNLWNQDLFRAWGEIMGKMHRLAGSYHSDQADELPHWDENALYNSVSLNSLEDEELWHKFTDAVYCLRKLKISSENYGIIHNDLHPGNLLTNKGHLSIIDFGDAEQGWFANDVAVIIYHALPGSKPWLGERRIEFARFFYRSFMEGYQKYKQVFPEWIEQIEFFLNYRLLYSTVYHLQHLKMDEASPQLVQLLSEMRDTAIHQESLLGLGGSLTK